MERRSHWTQTLSIVIPTVMTMIGLAIASEHRITVVESGLQEMKNQTTLLTQNQKMVMDTLAKTTILLEITMKRHELEDQKGKK